MEAHKLTDQEADAASGAWLTALRGGRALREQALSQLHGLLLRAARAETARRRESLPAPVLADIDDLCQQAADDALVAITRKLHTFRGESRFTTWAYAFVILEVSTQVRRHAWRGSRIELDEHGWDELADPRAPDGPELAERRELLKLIRTASTKHLTARQRLVFEAVVLRDVSIDVLADQLESTRGAIYKTLHDARRKLRATLVEAGYSEFAAQAVATVPSRSQGRRLQPADTFPSSISPRVPQPSVAATTQKQRAAALSPFA